MKLTINKIDVINAKNNTIFLVPETTGFSVFGLGEPEISYISECFVKEEDFVFINQYTRFLYFVVIPDKSLSSGFLEKLRKTAAKIALHLQNNKQTMIAISDQCPCNNQQLIAFTEGLALSAYQFINYQAKKENHTLSTIEIFSEKITDYEIKQLSCLVDMVFLCRNWVNEPYSSFGTEVFIREMKKNADRCRLKIEILDKAQIEENGMNGLLAVNRGSSQPPAFAIMEWKPEGAINNQPVVLVGKGIVFDSGGFSLKPTKDSMDCMKSDMAGGAAVACTLLYIASMNLPVHVVGLIPVTDNLPGRTAYVPGDVIKMHNGLFVEVLNTDAEGRLILADALSYAAKYHPEFIIEMSTLTGSAAAALGSHAIAAMGNIEEIWKNALFAAGEKTHERLVEFPFWEEYGEYLKSDIADLKNVGGKEAGAITAGKFLGKFATSPFIHLDIAGTAFITKTDSYRGKGGTGSGVRLLAAFIHDYIELKNHQNI